MALSHAKTTTAASLPSVKDIDSRTSAVHSIARRVSVSALHCTVPLPQLPPPRYPDSVDEERVSPIAFNDRVGKELDIELAHVLRHEKTIWCLKFSHDGRYLAAGCYDGKVYIYDVLTGILTW